MRPHRFPMACEVRAGLHWLASGWLCGLFATVAAGQPVVTGQRVVTGTVETVTSDGLTIRDAAGDVQSVRVQGKGEPGIALSDGTLLAATPLVRVSGECVVARLRPGRIVRFRCLLNDAGRADGTIRDLTVLDGDGVELGVRTVDPEGSDDDSASRYREREVTAAVKLAGPRRLVVELPADRAYARKTVLGVPLERQARGRLESDDPARIEPGARVERLEAIWLANGDLVARRLEVENPAAGSLADRGDDPLERKYRGLSDEPPAEPRLVRSPHFAFVTDVSDREWAVIRDKLERMVAALETFLGRRMTGVVEGFVARDLARFPAGLIDDEYGLAKIRRGEGVCMNSSLGRQRQARLYACGDHGVIQHECVHGICHLAFGSTGPTWLSEGLAELGQYWRADDQTVDLPPPVVAHLQHAEPKRTLLEIAEPGRTASGTWQDYAWRWAVCHLLANNPNYSSRFVPLAIGLMERRPGVSFESVYGPVAKEVSFEYDQFLATLGNGYRSDLTAWPWTATFQKLSGSAEKTVPIKARAGWQAARVLVEPGTTYDVMAEGRWRIAAAGQPLDADGEADGRGRLVAAVFADFRLSAEVPLGREASFEPPVAGQLFLRCADAWTELADNDGELRVTIRRGGQPATDGPAP